MLSIFTLLNRYPELFHLAKLKPVPIKYFPFFPIPVLLSVSMTDHFSSLMKVESYSICPFTHGLFHLA